MADTSTPIATQRGCPGQYLRTRGHTAPLCYGCGLYGEKGEQLEPQARFTPGDGLTGSLTGAWDCTNKQPLLWQHQAGQG